MKEFRYLLSLATLAFFAGCTTSPDNAAQSAFEDAARKMDKYQFTEADSAFAALSVDFPTSQLGTFGRALILERQLLWFDALHEFTKIIEAAPTFSPVYRAAGRLYARVGEAEEAVKSYSTYLSISPEDSQAQLELVRSAFKAHNFDLVDKSFKRAKEAGLAAKVVDLSLA